MIIKLNKTVTFEGKEYSEFELRDDLTGRDVLAVRKEFIARNPGDMTLVFAANLEFCLMFAAKYSGLPLEFFESLPAATFLNAMLQISNFLSV